MTRTRPNPWLLIPQPNPQASLRLFCFPYAGGGAVIFHKWPSFLPTEVEVCAIELPGRGTRIREAPLTQMTTLVQAVAQVLVPDLDIPFAFYGHSMGAVISFELARQLRREHGLKPVHLFVSGHRAPQIPDTDPPTYNLPEPEFIEELQRLNGTPVEVLENPELRRLIIPILRADLSVCQTYVYEADAPLATPMSAFGGLQDEDVTRDLIDAWRYQTTAPFSLRMLPGGHFFIQTAQPLLLEILSQDLIEILP